MGGGDTAVVFAWEGRKLPQSSNQGTAWESQYRDWANRSYDQVQGSMACVRGDVVHLYHGSRQNRQYVERYKILHENAFDPARDVEVDSGTGLLRWSAARKQKPDLVWRVAEYFEGRREDD